MNSITCLLCDSRKIFELIKRKDILAKMPVYKCKSCGVVYLLNHRHKVDDGYWNKEQQAEIYMDHSINEEFTKEFNNRLSAIMRIKPSGNLLDIGCGMGEFLIAAKNKGFRVFGLDVSHQAITYVKERMGLDAEIATIEQSNLPNNYFDVITMWDVWEHIQEPHSSIEAINSKLKKNGLLVIKTPNENSLFKIISRYAYLLSGKRISFLVKYVYYLPHYFSYTKRVLTNFLKNNGFLVTKIELENSNSEFAKAKINTHYCRSSSKNMVLSLLPLFYTLARIFHLQNKMVIYAIKKA